MIQGKVKKKYYLVVHLSLHALKVSQLPFKQKTGCIEMERVKEYIKLPSTTILLTDMPFRTWEEYVFYL